MQIQIMDSNICTEFRFECFDGYFLEETGSGDCCKTREKVTKDVRKLFHETVPAAWLSEEGGSRRQAPRIVAMATRLLVTTGHIVLPVEYLFYPLQEAARAMDRFVPSSKQPQHWSRNYNGSQENRRRSNAQPRVSPDTEVNNTSTYGQGITLRAEDLLGESDNRLGTGAAAVHLLSPRPDDRKTAMGGSATELTQCDRPRAPLRRSSEGNYAPRRRKSSSSSNAADDPTSSDPSNTSCTASSSSSSESGCNGDSETCNYCRLSESSGDSYECRDSTDDERSSSSLDGPDRRPRVLTRALSEDCNPPSRANRPLRRTSPGEYLRHKRNQMERLRNERLTNASPGHNPKSKITFQRCDSDPRLCLKKSSYPETTHSRTLNFVSPTRNRIRQSQQQQNRQRKKQHEDIGRTRPAVRPFDTTPNNALDIGNVRPNVFQGDITNNAPDIGNARPVVFQSDTTNNAPEDVAHPAVQYDTAETTRRPKRSAQAWNVADRTSRSTERRPSVVWNTEDSMPFLECGASFHCAVCDMDVPFTNCALCSAEAEVIIVDEEHMIVNSGQEFVATDSVFRTQDSIEELERSDDRNERGELLAKSDSQSSEEKKELEEFYDEPTKSHTPPIVATKDSPEDKKGQWTSRGAIHKSFNQEDAHSSRRKSSHLLRKYKSEPVPEAEVEDYYIPSKSQPEFSTFRNSRSDNSQSRAESSSSSSSRSDKNLGYHVAKESPRRTSAEEESQSSCQTCDKNTEEETSADAASSRVLSPDVVVQEKTQNQRKSPVFLKPEFIFEPEIIHKANPLVDDADVEVLPSALSAFRRLSEDEFISTLNIHEAARKGDLHVVKLLTKKDPKQMETVDERGWTPIHLAAAYGHSEVVRYLATEGAHLAALDPSSYTALHLAAMNGHPNCLEVLLPMGVDLDSTTAEGFTPLHLAVMNGHLECIRTLLRWGSSMDKRDSLGRGIYEMVEEYKLEDVAILLRRYHKKMHNVKHMLEMIHRNEDRSSTEIPQEFIDILASIAEESGTE